MDPLLELDYNRMMVGNPDFEVGNWVVRVRWVAHQEV